MKDIFFSKSSRVNVFVPIVLFISYMKRGKSGNEAPSKINETF